MTIWLFLSRRTVSMDTCWRDWREGILKTEERADFIRRGREEVGGGGRK